MSSSFSSALGGMRANQRWIDVIGNNLANQNTPGFKGSRALFGDLFSLTHRNATGPNSAVGGTNSLQTGLGSQLSAVDRSLNQGALDVTGRTFDLALLGEGYFAASDGDQTYYTRVGTFGLDAEGTMVDLTSGLRVLDNNGQTFSIDTRAVLPPSETSEVNFTGNLPAVVTGPLTEELTSSSTYAEGAPAISTGANGGPFNIPVGETWTMELVVDGGAPQEVAILGAGALTTQELADAVNAQTEDIVASVAPGGELILTSERSGEDANIKANAGVSSKDLKNLAGLVDFVQGSESAADQSTDLNDLASSITDYEVGDVIDLAGTDSDGSAVVTSFTYGVDGTTLGEMVSFLDSAFTQSAVSFSDSTGQIEITSDVAGEAELSLSITDQVNQSGKSDWNTHFFAVTTNGTGPDTVTSSIETYDESGSSHILTFDYERQADGSWNMQASIPPEDGVVLNGTVTGITFNENGSILSPTSAELTVQFEGQSEQTIDIDLGTAGQFEGITQFGNPASLIAEGQDGFGAGELTSFQVDGTGLVEGYFSNGQTQELASFGIASFTNEAALEAVGGNYFQESANSGQRILGAGGINGNGDVVGGAIEASNVDTAVEFVNLIQAQRGFQSNARVITVQDELLSEIVNIV
ncbi:MAG: flagellar hook protein FlgE [Planctomycetota bacterium]|jgi:flagellar hook protein FlgE